MVRRVVVDLRSAWFICHDALHVPGVSGPSGGSRDLWDSVDLLVGQRRPLLRPSLEVEERGPTRRICQYNVADVQARLAGDDCAGVRRVDWWFMCRVGLFSKGPEAPALAVAESSFQERFFRLFVVARGLALRPTSGRGGVDVDPGEAAGLRLCGCGGLPVLTLFLP